MIEPDKNKIVLSQAGEISGTEPRSARTNWSEPPVHEEHQSGTELQFEPEATASYDLSARVLNVIKGSGVSRFGFVGNEQYRAFGKAE